MTEEEKQNEFNKVIKTFIGNKVMTRMEDDGIYIRLAGNVDKGESFSLEWIKVISFKNTNP